MKTDDGAGMKEVNKDQADRKGRRYKRSQITVLGKINEVRLVGREEIKAAGKKDKNKRKIVQMKTEGR